MMEAKYSKINENDKLEYAVKLVVRKEYPNGSGSYPDALKKPARWHEGQWVYFDGSPIKEEILGIDK